MTKKYFTIEQAEALLPALSTNVRRLRKLRYQMAMIQQSRESLPQLVQPIDSDGMYYYVRKEIGLNRQYHSLASEFFDRVDRIIVEGAILQDLDDGTVDFPHRFNGREVMLCWKLGEKAITHWHELDDEERQEFLDLDEAFRELLETGAGEGARKRRQG
jgi:hypothetical protein